MTGSPDEPIRVHLENATEDVSCPTGCGATVRWSFLRRGSRRLPPVPPPCETCRMGSVRDREEAARQAEEERARLEEEARAEQQRRRVAEREANILDVLREAGVNTREHGHVTLDDFDFSECGPDVGTEVRCFIDETRLAGPHDAVQGLYLAGTTGNGKTQLLACIARELLMDPDWSPADVVFDVAAELLTEVQDTYRGEGSTRRVKERRIKARVWLLDDLGTERPTEDAARVLYEIVNARAFAPTAIASNHSPAEIEKRHPELSRVVSRLGPAYFRGVRVKGKDRRYRRTG